MATRPSTKPEWASADIAGAKWGENNVIEPDITHKTEGWGEEGEFTRNYDNWFKRTAGLWLDYLDERFVIEDLQGNRYPEDDVPNEDGIYRMGGNDAQEIIAIVQRDMMIVYETSGAASAAVFYWLWDGSQWQPKGNLRGGALSVTSGTSNGWRIRYYNDGFSEAWIQVNELTTFVTLALPVSVNIATAGAGCSVTTEYDATDPVYSKLIETSGRITDVRMRCVNGVKAFVKVWGYEP